MTQDGRERETTVRRLRREFASTFREWHYLVGGGATGFVVGVVAVVYVLVRLERRRRRRRRRRGERRPGRRRDR
jgi:multisubunit Na+/H+ antiporter MnhB subunit